MRDYMTTTRHPDAPVLFVKNPEQVAQRLVMCGDPGRVELFADLLHKATPVDMDRGYIGFTGKFNDERVTVMQHGLGGPSAEAVVGELAHAADPRVIIRVGSGEGNRSRMKKGELVLPSLAIQSGGVIRAMKKEGKVLGYTVDTTADPELIGIMSEMATDEGFTVHEGTGLKVLSTDTFWTGGPAPAKAAVVDMEAATILALGNRFGIRTAALLIVNKNLVTETGYERAEHLPENAKQLAGAIALTAVTEVEISSDPNPKKFVLEEGWVPRG